MGNGSSRGGHNRATERAVMVQLLARCPRCRAPVGIGALSERTCCGACGTEIALSADFWRSALTRAVGDGLNVPEGKGRAERLPGRPPMQLLFGQSSPSCACGAELPIGDLDRSTTVPALDLMSGGENEPPATAGTLYCPMCGAEQEIRSAPDWLVAAYPTASTIVFTRRHPANTHRFYVLVATGNAVGALPGRTHALCDFALTPNEDMVLAWEERRQNKSSTVIARADRRGLLRWRSGGLGLGRDLLLIHRRQANEIVVADRQRGLVAWLCADSGRLLRSTAPSPNGQNNLLIDVRNHRGLGLLPDDSFLVAKEEVDGVSALHRFDDGGRRLPLWGETKASETSGRWSVTASSLDTSSDRPTTIPPGCFFRVGGDGHLHIIEAMTGSVLRFGLDGQLLQRLDPKPGSLGRVLDLGADADGNLILLFEDPGGAGVRLLGTLEPDGHVDPWLTVDGRVESVVGRRLKCGLSGTVIVGDDRIENLRRLAPPGAHGLLPVPRVFGVGTGAEAKDRHAA